MFAAGAPINFLHGVSVAGHLQINTTYITNRFEIGAVSNTAILSGVSLYASQVREFLAPVGGLRERDGELEVLTGFCRGAQPYLWIRAEPWAGKTALLAWFTLYPPPDVRVVSFFVTDRLADQSDHTAFTSAILEQLAVSLPFEQRALIATTMVNRDGLCSDLLASAARREAQAGRRLVLVVDGLDEDTGRPAIATLLPAQPDPNLRIIVASRHEPRQPVPQGHPLTRARPYLLKPSPFAADLRDLAVEELDELLLGPAAHRDLLALIAAANGLTGAELAELTGMAPFQIDTLLRGVSGRSFRSRTVPAGPDGPGDPVYALAHETLQRTAEQRIGRKILQSCWDRLNAWADQYRDLGWPTHTPDFLMRRYFPQLDRVGDLPRMAALALDSARHDRIWVHTGGDSTALAEIRIVQQHICDQPDPDLQTTARLARYRDRLHHRNNNIPTSLPPLWVRLGYPDRAEALARGLPDQAEALTGVAQALVCFDPDRADTLVRSMPDPQTQDSAFATMAIAVACFDPDRAEALVRDIADPHVRAKVFAFVGVVVAGTDPARAHRLADCAEGLARAIPDPRWRSDVLYQVAGAVNGFDTDRAEALVHDLPGNWRPIGDVLANLAAMVAGADADHAVRLAEHVEALARDRPNPWPVTAFAEVAIVVASSDPERAHRLAERAEALARDNPTSQQQLVTTVRLAVMAGTDPERAEALAREIPDLHLQTDILVRMAEVVADTDPERAVRLADLAEALARDIPDPRKQGELAAVLADVAVAVVTSDPDRATRLADRAEALARDIPDVQWQGEVLADVATVVAGADPDRAAALAHDIADPYWQGAALADVATVVAGADPDRAETLVLDIFPDVSERDQELIRVAEAVADTDPDRAEAFVRHTPDLWEQAEVLVRVARAVAGTAPDRARRLADHAEALVAGDVSDEQAMVLPRIAGAVACFDPGRAGRLADRAEALARNAPNGGWLQTEILSRIAEAVACFDPDRAEALAREAVTWARRPNVIAVVAEVIASIDPDRAEALAREIAVPQTQASALVGVAKAIATSTGSGRIEHPHSHAGSSQSLTGMLIARNKQSKRLLAHVWSIAGWAIPMSALPIVDTSVLHLLLSELTGE
ncbi:hypothetical protein ACTD5D_19270 [Nocardia takedensis]|uniref:hypothetical protein n=1 Tax=Nocardia takedensis TaxID=259390 RepID=UPI003F75BBFB